ncbi:FkbM family methyltransferase [Acidicapsa acidisoli]|uniref:FkbM family methyltransferase n=1 Tax=Acidicapsa acidisoli TaxID=1615681 RepID=UPI0021E09338|nr:FkbM family methyltransferase [Acidicapsa acidisoli]
MTLEATLSAQRQNSKTFLAFLDWLWRQEFRILRLRLYRLIREWMDQTPYEFEVRRRLPSVTLKPLDLILASYNSRGEKSTILQIGACDGVTNDPIYHHVAKGMTRAILVEPNPYSFARLQHTYAGLPNVTLIQSAIGYQNGEAYLYRVKRTDISDSDADLTLQIASFSRKHLEAHGTKPYEIERIIVPCRSLSSLVTELGLSNIDLLQIDAEGFDADVVRMALKLPIPPVCIHFEHTHLTSANRRPLFNLLTANGYLLGRDTCNILALQMTFIEELSIDHDGATSGQAKGQLSP